MDDVAAGDVELPLDTVAVADIVDAMLGVDVLGVEVLEPVSFPFRKNTAKMTIATTAKITKTALMSYIFYPAFFLPRFFSTVIRNMQTCVHNG